MQSNQLTVLHHHWLKEKTKTSEKIHELMKISIIHTRESNQTPAKFNISSTYEYILVDGEFLVLNAPTEKNGGRGCWKASQEGPPHVKQISSVFYFLKCLLLTFHCFCQELKCFMQAMRACYFITPKAMQRFFSLFRSNFYVKLFFKVFLFFFWKIDFYFYWLNFIVIVFVVVAFFAVVKVNFPT